MCRRRETREVRVEPKDAARVDAQALAHPVSVEEAVIEDGYARILARVQLAVDVDLHRALLLGRVFRCRRRFAADADVVDVGITRSANTSRQRAKLGPYVRTSRS